MVARDQECEALAPWTLWRLERLGKTKRRKDLCGCRLKKRYMLAPWHLEMLTPPLCALRGEPSSYSTSGIQPATSKRECGLLSTPAAAWWYASHPCSRQNKRSVPAPRTGTVFAAGTTWCTCSA